MAFNGFVFEKVRRIRIMITGYNAAERVSDLRKKYMRVIAQERAERATREIELMPAWEDTYIEEEETDNNMNYRNRFEDDADDLAQQIAELNRPITPFGSNHGVTEELFSTHSLHHGGRA